jgi:hypothetical protein
MAVSVDPPPAFAAYIYLSLSAVLSVLTIGYVLWKQFGETIIEIGGPTMRVSRGLAGATFHRREIAAASVRDVFLDEHRRSKRTQQIAAWRVTIVSSSPPIRVAMVFSVREGNQIVNTIIDRIEQHRKLSRES